MKRTQTLLNCDLFEYIVIFFDNHLSFAYLSIIAPYKKENKKKYSINDKTPETENLKSI